MRASGDLDISPTYRFHQPTGRQSDDGIRGFYITHTNNQMSATPKLGCGLTSSRVLDRVAATPPPYPRTWFWDNLHVLSILNEHYNDMLWHAIQD